MKILFVLLLAMFASSPPEADSKTSGCGEYIEMLNSNARQLDLIRWADREVFSKSFEQEDFDEITGFVGPGRNGANFSIERSGIALPPWLDGYTIRAVGPDKSRPNVLLVGRRRYQGILITRGEFGESLAGTTVDRSRVEKQVGRLALLCYPD